VRNRLIAALAGGTLLVESAARSGAQSTARAAQRLGRAVMAVPGPVTSAMSVGCHALVRDGTANLVSSVDEVVELVGLVGVDLAARPEGHVRATDGLDADGLALYDALPRRAARDMHRLAQDSGVDPAAMATRLSDLEGRGLAEGRDGRWRRRPQ
jgi:DNA processing protein